MKYLIVNISRNPVVVSGSLINPGQSILVNSITDEIKSLVNSKLLEIIPQVGN
jgi:hypothetical protein